MNTTVRSADRALAIFETFEDARRQLPLREIAERCEMPLSTCHALVQTLLRRGYLYTIGRRKELYPNRRLLVLADTIVQHDPFLARMSGILEKLRDECGESVIVGKRQGDAVLYLHVLDGPHPIRYAAKVGVFRPLHATAIGKALLSKLGDDELKQWLKTHRLERVMPKTIVSPEKLLKELEVGRQRGYFTASNEFTLDLTAISVPVSLHRETLGILLAGPAQRMESSIKKYAVRLLEVKATLERGKEKA